MATAGAGVRAVSEGCPNENAKLGKCQALLLMNDWSKGSSDYCLSRGKGEGGACIQPAPIPDKNELFPVGDDTPPKMLHCVEGLMDGTQGARRGCALLLACRNTLFEHP